MATIDYKEKYEQALERARQFSEKPYLEDSAEIVEYIFPELKESEDEKIKQELIEYHKAQAFLDGKPNNKHVKFVALLEKQGEMKPTEWSEEDEKHIHSIISTIECCKVQFPNAQAAVEAYNADIDWLKSLKERYTWKPSDKQVKVIGHICDGNYNVDLDILDSIYRDFKKLREE